MTAPPDDMIADLHATIVALRQELDERLAERDAALAREVALAEALATRTVELTTRNREFVERFEHQAATIEVLKAMSASTGDEQAGTETHRATCARTM